MKGHSSLYYLKKLNVPFAFSWPLSRDHIDDIDDIEEFDVMFGRQIPSKADQIARRDAASRCCNYKLGVVGAADVQLSSQARMRERIASPLYFLVALVSKD